MRASALISFGEEALKRPSRTMGKFTPGFVSSLKLPILSEVGARLDLIERVVIVHVGIFVHRAHGGAVVVAHVEPIVARRDVLGQGNVKTAMDRQALLSQGSKSQHGAKTGHPDRQNAFTHLITLFKT